MILLRSLDLEAANRRVSSTLTSIAFKPFAAALVLIILCSTVYLPGLASLPVTDRDEARFAQATRQMIETGNFVDIRFQDVPRYKKPIGIYWLQSASASIAQAFGAAIDDIWAYRIPSFLSAVGAVLLTFWTARPIVGRRPAFLAAALLATGLTLTFEAHIAKSDAALTLAIMMTQGALFRLYMARDPGATRGLALLFWAGLGTAILLKGPVGPALACLTAGVVCLRDKQRGWLQNLHWRWGFPLLLAITLPWFIAIGVSSGGAFFKASLGQDFATKIQGGQESHWGPPGLYFLLFWWTFWPATLFVTAYGAKRFWRERGNRRALFILAWIVPYWLLIEAIPTKLPHYALPIYPAVAIAAASMLGSIDRRTRPAFGRVVPSIWIVIAFLHAIALVAVAWLFQENLVPAILGGLGIAAATAFTVAAVTRRCMEMALISAILSAAIFYIAAFGFVLPGAEAIWLSSASQKAARALAPCGAEAPVFAGYSEPSAVFSNGTKTGFSDAEGAADALSGNRTSLAFVTWGRRAEFEDRYRQQTGEAPAFLGCVDGLNLNGRGPRRLQIYTQANALHNRGCAPVTETSCRDKAGVRWRRLLDTAF